MSELVSVVIPSFNHSKYITDCIKSLIAQTYDNIELIIIDDGSSDNSRRMIEALRGECEKRFKRFEFRYRSNMGLCRTLNEGLDWLSGYFFAPMASDDIWDKDKIEKQVKLFKSRKDPRLAGVFTGIKIITKDSRVIMRKSKAADIEFDHLFLRKISAPGQTIMMRSEVVKAVGGYDPKYKIEDLQVFLKICSKGFYFSSIENCLVYYRRHEGNLSANNEAMLSAMLSILNEYSANKKYKRALSRVYLMHAHAVQTNARVSSLKYLFKSILLCPLNILSKSMFKYIVKSFWKPYKY